MSVSPNGYPHHLAGEPADAPTAPPANLLRMARRAEGRALAATEPARAAGDWRLAGSIAVLGDEANAANPGRDKSSDGTIGDARHIAEGKASDHNPWVIVAGKGVVRARDIDVDGLDLPTAFERGRQLAFAGKLPQVTPGGYFILNGRITAEHFEGWRVYTGADQHVTHGHVSVALTPAQFDSRAPWGIFTAAPAPTPPPAPARWTGPDLRGAGPLLRGEVGANGPRVQLLQRALRSRYPAYAGGLADDGWWGPRTSAALAEFGRRSSIPEADGANIGPKLALALFRAGVRL